MYISSLIDIGLNFWQLKSDIPQLYQTVKNYQEKEEVDDKDYFDMGLQTLLVTNKSLLIFLTIYNLRLQNKLSQTNLSLEQKEKLQKKLKIVFQGIFVNRASLLASKMFERIRAGDNLLDIDLLFDTSNLLANGLYAVDKISREQFEHLDAGLTFAQGSCNLASVIKNPSKLEKTLELYDYLFPTYSLNQIEINLADLDFNVTYEGISEEHKINRVFRHFKCSLMKEPIRYPVIVVDENDKPLQPLKLFERKFLLWYVTNSDEPTYPSSNIAPLIIQIASIKEHLGVRAIIEQELQRLEIN